jgi:hypothetical protein
VLYLGGVRLKHVKFRSQWLVEHVRGNSMLSKPSILEGMLKDTQDEIDKLKYLVEELAKHVEEIKRVNAQRTNRG